MGSPHNWRQQTVGIMGMLISFFVVLALTATVGNAANIRGYGYPVRLEGGLYRYTNEDLHLLHGRTKRPPINPITIVPSLAKPIKPLGAPFPPTIVSSRPHYSSEIE